MSTRRSAALLLGGLLVTLIPTGAAADHGGNDRCTYRCEEPDHGAPDGYRHDCWYHDGERWRACYDRDRYGYGGDRYDHGGRHRHHHHGSDDDSAHASGGYDSHRRHPRH